MKISKPCSNLFLFFVMLMVTIFATGCGGGGGGSGIADGIAPTVMFTDATANATDVPLNRSLSAIFSEALNSTTANATTFTLSDGSAAVLGNVSYASNTMIFKPTANLAANSTYTATISTGVKDLAGNALATDVVWNFTTGTTADNTIPTAISKVPGLNVVDVPINRGITIFFSETLDPTTFDANTFTLTSGGVPVAGTVSYAIMKSTETVSGNFHRVGNTMTFTPTKNLAPNTTYVITIAAGFKDLAGNTVMTDIVWSFTTGTSTDITSPVVISKSPAINAVDVPFNLGVSALFSEALSPATFNANSFTLTNDGVRVLGTVSYASNTMTFKSTSDFSPNTTYTATINTGIKDLAGNALATAQVWSFTTGAAPDTTAPTVISKAPTANAVDVAFNISISALFSETLDPTTVNSTNFTLSDGSAAVLGNVSYASNTMTFTPDSDLDASSTYTATITTGVKDLAGNALATAQVWSFTTGAAPDTTAPTVISKAPTANAVDVAFNISISALFSETLDPTTVNSTNFTLSDGSGAVLGNVSYASNTMTFTPDSDLDASSTYTATITTGIKDLAGNALATAQVWSFTTGVAPDTTAPEVVSTDPVANAIGAILNGTISALFNETLDPATVNTNTFALMQVNEPVPGIVSYESKTMIFSPNSDLESHTAYTATITTGVKDLSGNTLAEDFIWDFTTGATADTSAPVVVSTDPIADTTNVPPNANISALFGEALDSTTVTTATFMLSDINGPISGVVSYLSNTIIFNPSSDLSSSTTYTATITTGVKDLAGNALAIDFSWDFTTGIIAALGPNPVNLGTAGNFVILAKTAISTTGVTNITGDIGVSPAARSYITGFSDTLFTDNTYSESPIVTGKIYAANMAVPTPANMTTAISDMETAYTDAAGRATPDFTELHAGDVSGQTLVPGLYKWGTGVLITNVGVTISGGPNDVWIFQIAQDLTLDSGAIVTLDGGAQAKNIFWQVAGGTGVSIGTTAQFKGIVLAQKGIVLFTNATVDGRLLAQTAVTLAANAVTAPQQ